MLYCEMRARLSGFLFRHRFTRLSAWVYPTQYDTDSIT